MDMHTQSMLNIRLCVFAHLLVRADVHKTCPPCVPLTRHASELKPTLSCRALTQTSVGLVAKGDDWVLRLHKNSLQSTSR